MKNLILGFLTMIAVLGIGSFEYLRLGFAEIRADANLPAWESRVVEFVVRASIRRSAAQLRNPIPVTDENLIAGGKLYLRGCVGCHGKPGKPRSNLLGYPPPPQFAEVGTQYSEAELFWVVRHGIRRTGMSAYRYPDDKTWAIAAFVKRMRNLPLTVMENIQPYE
jgi:mono/diheme cytochrome c family protein